MILVTGATGQLGAAVVKQLIQRNARGKFAVFARDRAKAAHYANQGIPIRLGDFDKPSALSKAFESVSKLLLISSRSMNRAQQQRQVIDAAVTAGVKHIIYTGLAIQDIHTSHVKSVMESHFETEAYIRSTGMPYTFLRNTMYADALPEIMHGNWSANDITLPAGMGKVPYALRREIGEATANLLLQADHEMQTYDITGSAAYSYHDIASALSKLVGYHTHYTDTDPLVFTQKLKSLGLPDFMVYLTSGTLCDVKDQQYELHSDALKTLLGREPASLTIMLREVLSIKRGAVTRSASVDA